MQYHKKGQDLNLEIQNQVTFSYMFLQNWGRRRRQTGGGGVKRGAASSN
jgi:hypothetical protein